MLLLSQKKYVDPSNEMEFFCTPCALLCYHERNCLYCLWFYWASHLLCYLWSSLLPRMQSFSAWKGNVLQSMALTFHCLKHVLQLCWETKRANFCNLNNLTYFCLIYCFTKCWIIHDLSKIIPVSYTHLTLPTKLEV